jgi:hypothetical protein
VLSCRRTLQSPSPDRIEIVDEIELAEPRAVSFLLHSALPMSAAAGRAWVAGSVFTLDVSAAWAVSRTARPCGVNWCYTPVNRLELRSRPDLRHRLLTVLQFRRPG